MTCGFRSRTARTGGSILLVSARTPVDYALQELARRVRERPAYPAIITATVTPASPRDGRTELAAHH